MLLEILVEIVLIWSFHVTFPSMNTPKNLVAVSLFRVMPSMNSSGNFAVYETLFKSGMKNCPFCFININRELICFKPSRDTF